jgi:hypothetical protein
MVEALLKKLKNGDEHFDCRILKNKACAPIGVVWMTRTMKQSWVLHGDNLSLDVMKRELNDLRWVCMGPVVFDNECRVVNACEALVLEEQLETCADVMNALFQMEPRRSNVSVSVMFADLVLSDDLLPLIGLAEDCSTKVIWDHFHLETDAWPKHFGDGLFKRSKACLGGLLRGSEQKHEESTEGIKHVLLDDPAKLDHIRERCEHPERFAARAINAIPGSLKRRGSQGSEAGHSGVLVALGKGSGQKMEFKIQQLLVRAAERLAKHHNQDNLCKFKCLAAKAEEEVEDEALHVLSDRSHRQLWVPNLAKAKSQTRTQLLDGSCQMLRNGMPPNSARIIRQGKRCGCMERASSKGQCRHETCNEGGFVKGLFDRRRCKQCEQGPVVITSWNDCGRAQTAQAPQDDLEGDDDEEGGMALALVIFLAGCLLAQSISPWSCPKKWHHGCIRCIPSPPPPDPGS